MGETEIVELGFALGFIAGEGSFTGDKQNPVLSVKVIAADTSSLLVLQRVFGGRIYGPYIQAAPRQPTAVWRLCGRSLARAVPVIRAYLPLSRKRVQFEEWSERWRTRFEPARREPP